MRDAHATETVRIEKVRDLSMRLTCPRCGAQYEIAAAAIPAAGREVECSACSHVWFQPGQSKAERSDAAPYDPQARPALNRPLNDSILAILRDETARELQARQTEAGKRAPATDQNIANTLAEPAAATAAADQAPADIAPIETPIETPGEPPIETPAMADADWPATTLTVAPPEPEPVPPAVVTPEPAPVETAVETAVETFVEIAAEPVAEPDAEPAEAMDQAEPAPFEFEPPAPAPETPEDEWRPEPVVAALPDAAELAATLTRPGPPPALPPAGARTTPVPTEPAADHTQETVLAAAPLPVVAAAKRGSGYASGFGLAAMLALGVVAVYALAPRVAADEDGGLLAEWRQDIDRGRLWLHDRIIGE